MSASVSVIMGSKSDWHIMKEACVILDQLGIENEKKIVSAHRSPDWLYEFTEKAPKRGIKIIIAGAGGAAHLPGMVAAKTLIPVIGVPVPIPHLQGLDSLLSIVQMPAGVPVATMAIGVSGAKNAALMSAQILAIDNHSLRKKLQDLRQEAAQAVLDAGEAEDWS